MAYFDPQLTYLIWKHTGKTRGIPLKRHGRREINKSSVIQNLLLHSELSPPDTSYTISCQFSFPVVKCHVGNTGKFGLHESTIQTLGIKMLLTIFTVPGVLRSIFMHHLTSQKKEA